MDCLFVYLFPRRADVILELLKKSGSKRKGKKEKVWRGNILNCSVYLLTMMDFISGCSGFLKRKHDVGKKHRVSGVIKARILQPLEGRTQEVKLQLPGRGRGGVHYAIPSCTKPIQVTSDVSLLYPGFQLITLRRWWYIRGALPNGSSSCRWVGPIAPLLICSHIVSDYLQRGR